MAVNTIKPDCQQEREKVKTLKNFRIKCIRTCCVDNIADAKPFKIEWNNT